MKSANIHVLTDVSHVSMPHLLQTRNAELIDANSEQTHTTQHALHETSQYQQQYAELMQQYQTLQQHVGAIAADVHDGMRVECAIRACGHVWACGQRCIMSCRVACCTWDVRGVWHVRSYMSYVAFVMLLRVACVMFHVVCPACTCPR